LHSPAGCRSVGDDVVGAVGVSGSPGKEDDCSKAGIDRVADQLK
jgi:uncharacterized protein GlcG (DUF336 family)